MNVSKLSFLVLVTGVSFGNQIETARADATTPVVSGSTGSPGGFGTTGPTTGIQFPNSIHSDREAIHEDRTNIRSDRSNIEKDRHDIRAAEHDIQINPQNKSVDLARIAADQKSIKGDRQDLNKNEHNLRQEQHQLRSAYAHQHPNTGVSQWNSASPQRPLQNNGFFPPTRRPEQNRDGVTGFGSESHHEHEHHEHEHHEHEPHHHGR